MRQDRFDHSVDHSDVTKPVRPRRIEVITGVVRRRRWPQGKKLEIVAESFQSGCLMSEVARRYDISPQQLFGWRAQLRAEVFATAPVEAPLFAPAVVDESMRALLTANPRPVESGPVLLLGDSTPSIEITLGRSVVKVRGSVDARTLAVILKALKVAR